MIPTISETGSRLITLLASLMLVLQLLVVGQRMLVTNIRLFALQSLLLAVIVAVVVVFDGDSNWLEGAAMITLYAIIATSFWWG